MKVIREAEPFLQEPVSGSDAEDMDAYPQVLEKRGEYLSNLYIQLNALTLVGLEEKNKQDNGNSLTYGLGEKRPAPADVLETRPGLNF